VRVLRHSVVDDVGRMVNPMLVKGQIHGASSRGRAGALRGADLRADDGPAARRVLHGLRDAARRRHAHLRRRFHEVPTQVNPLGAKGVGEAGTVGALPALLNAVNDALAPLGVRHLDMPVTSERSGAPSRTPKHGAERLGDFVATIIRGGRVLDARAHRADAADVLITGDTITEIGAPGLALRPTRPSWMRAASSFTPGSSTPTPTLTATSPRAWATAGRSSFC